MMATMMDGWAIVPNFYTNTEILTTLTHDKDIVTIILIAIPIYLKYQHCFPLLIRISLTRTTLMIIDDLPLVI